MGLDLAMYVERREGGRWVLADPAVWYEDMDWTRSMTPGGAPPRSTTIAAGAVAT